MSGTCRLASHVAAAQASRHNGSQLTGVFVRSCHARTSSKSRAFHPPPRPRQPQQEQRRQERLLGLDAELLRQRAARGNEHYARYREQQSLIFR